MKRGKENNRILAFFLMFAMVFSSLDITAFAANPNVDEASAMYMSSDEGWMSPDQSISQTEHLVAYAISDTYVRAYADDSAEFRVYAYAKDDQGKSIGDKSLTYQWYKSVSDTDGMSPDESGTVDVTEDEMLWGEASDVLEFSKVSKDVEGSYYVVVTDTNSGEQVKIRYHLRIVGLNVNVSFKQYNCNLNEGEDFTLEVMSSTNKLRDLTYKWFYRADRNNDWQELTGEMKSYYQITSMSKADAGYYRVEATNTNGDMGYDEVRVYMNQNSNDNFDFSVGGRFEEETVDYKDSNPYYPINTYRYLGDSVTMKGYINPYGSYPETPRDYTYAWAKYDENTASYFTIHGANDISYTIPELKEEDFGEYRFSATCGNYTRHFYFYLNRQEWNEYDGNFKAYVKGYRYRTNIDVEKKLHSNITM